MVPDPLRIKEVRLFNVKGAEVTSVYASQVLTALQRAQNRIYGSGLTLREKGRLLERCAQNILRTILVNELREEDLTEVLRGMLPSDLEEAAELPPHISRLFIYFRTNDPPANYGYTCVLPSGLTFLFKSVAESVMIVRLCYRRLLSIICKRLSLDVETRGSGILFTGGQGNSKSWCSLFILWYMLRMGRTVVYEISDQGIVYVIRSDGSSRQLKGPACAAVIPELYQPETIHIYDAKADSNGEPVESEAFLIEFSSRNMRNYAQTIRRVGLQHYCIPSYTTEELLDFSELFKVESEIVLQRCDQIGPSVRSILVDDFEVCWNHTETAARKVSTAQIDSYICNSRSLRQGMSGTGDDISACLVLAVVHEELFEDDPDKAYKDENVTWQFASQHLAQLVLDSVGKNALEFVRNFIVEVNKYKMTGMKGVAGNYLELVLKDFICRGFFHETRLLVDNASKRDRGDNVGDSFILFDPWPGKQLRTEVSAEKTVTAVLSRNCDDETLYLYSQSFPAIDMSAKSFRVLFQVTVAASHTIHLETILTICKQVREQFGEDEIVWLCFVVPREVVVRDVNCWRRTQSFRWTEEVMRLNQAGQEVKSKEIKTCMFHNLPEEFQVELRNLRQRVVCF